MMNNKKCFTPGITLREALFVSFAFAVILSASPCYAAGNSERQNAGETPSIPEYNHSPEPAAANELIFIGVSPRFLNRSESIRTALNDAARKLSFYYYVSASSESLQHAGAYVFDVSIDSDYRLQYDNELDKYLKLLDYNLDNDISENNNTVFITARIASNVSMPAFRGHSASQTRPYWIDTPPSQIGGFTAGVGFSARLISHSDTIVRSYEKAVISIIENMEVHVHGDYLLYQNTGVFGFEAQSSGGSKASGALENFYVIESWTDPASLSVWTLAVAGGKH
jgi:hypothetical protein